MEQSPETGKIWLKGNNLSRFQESNQETVLMADDDPDDRFLAKEAFQEVGSCIDLQFVEDGEELMHFLQRSRKYSNSNVLLSPRPKFILLDINMPRKNGMEALREIKTDPVLKDIPVVIWTTSKDIMAKVQYQKIGADDIFVKPSSYNDLKDVLRQLVIRYCLDQKFPYGGRLAKSF